MAQDFAIPELGENIETIQVVKILVAVDDKVDIDQPILELETDKATIEVPSSIAGVVSRVHVTEGQEVSVGQVVLSFEGGDAVPAKSEVAATAAAPAPDEAPSRPAAEAPSPTAPAAAKEEAPAPEPEADIPAVSTEPRLPGTRVPAAPSVRKFAREIGIDIARVTGTGPHGRASMDDVKRYAKQLNEGRIAAPSAQVAPGFAAFPPLPDFEKWGSVQREKMSVIRRKTAERMSASWTTVPHVTIFDKADITELEVLRKRYAPRAEEAGGKLTMAVMVVKVTAQALKVFPAFNASIDMAAREVVFKKYCNIGIAVAIDRGLLVPVIRDADKKNMVQIAVEVTQIAERARSGKVGVEELEGGTFTVTNLGRICGTYFTPIVNAPEVAILGIGRAFEEADPHGGKPRTVLPLSLSFDHRLIDGADGARFLGWIVEAIQEPLVLALEG